MRVIEDNVTDTIVIILFDEDMEALKSKALRGRSCIAPITVRYGGHRDNLGECSYCRGAILKGENRCRQCETEVPG